MREDPQRDKEGLWDGEGLSERRVGRMDEETFK